MKEDSAPKAESSFLRVIGSAIGEWPPERKELTPRSE